MITPQEPNEFLELVEQDDRSRRWFLLALEAALERAGVGQEQAYRRGVADGQAAERQRWLQAGKLRQTAMKVIERDVDSQQIRAISEFEVEP